MAKKLTKARNAVNTSKSQQIIGMLRRASGASVPELVKATDWQSHSVRGFMSGALKKKLGLKIVSVRAEGKDRRYMIQDAS